MDPAHVIYTAHVLELAGSNCSMDMEIARVFIGCDPDLAAADIWKDRSLKIMLPATVGQVPTEVKPGMYTTAQELLHWIGEVANETAYLNGRGLLQVLVKRLELERRECERGACLIYLRELP